VYLSVQVNDKDLLVKFAKDSFLVQVTSKPTCTVTKNVLRARFVTRALHAEVI